MSRYIMALDAGTTSSRCILFDKGGNIASVSQKEFPQIYPKPGWVEHDPMDIWSTQIGVAEEAAAKIGAEASDIAAIGITNQRETTVLWDKNTGKPVYNAIVWQCRRTSDMIDDMPEEMRSLIHERTGLVADAYFSATKIKWIMDNVPGVREEAEKGNILFGTVDTWIMWNLSGRRIHATDYTNASRSMLFDIRKLEWDKEILEYFGIPEAMMPEVYPSGYFYGMTDRAFFGDEIPVAAACGDQQSSLFGLCCFEKGEVKNTYGTGCFLLMNTGDEIVESENGLITTIAATASKEICYALEGSIFIGGAVIQWIRDELGLIEKSSESEKAALKVADTLGAYLVPAFTGLGAPYWKQDVRGTMVGLTRGFNKNHFIRAALESIAYQSLDVIRAMEADVNCKMSALKADGGASANDMLMQFQSDITGADIIRPEMVENTALGAAYLAGLTTGFWKDRQELKKNSAQDRTFSPLMDEAERSKRIKGWKKAVKAACAWSED